MTSEPIVGATPRTIPLFDMVAAFKEAGFAALVTLGLSFPILALRAESDMSNTLVLIQRWSWPLTAAVLVFIGLFLVLFLQPNRRTEKVVEAPKARAPALQYLSRYIG